MPQYKEKIQELVNRKLLNIGQSRREKEMYN
jgi:hypothetical protein